MPNKSHTATFSLIAGVALLLAIPPLWPYWYYQVLKWAVTAIAIFNAYEAHSHKRKEWTIIMTVIAVLFNPILPIFFSKGAWAVVDLITAILMFVSIRKIKGVHQ